MIPITIIIVVIFTHVTIIAIAISNNNNDPMSQGFPIYQHQNRPLAPAIVNNPQGPAFGSPISAAGKPSMVSRWGRVSGRVFVAQHSKMDVWIRYPPWKWMVGILVSFWVSAHLQVRAVSFREGIGARTRSFMNPYGDTGGNPSPV